MKRLLRFLGLRSCNNCGVEQWTWRLWVAWTYASLVCRRCVCAMYTTIIDEAFAAAGSHMKGIQ